MVTGGSIEDAVSACELEISKPPGPMMPAFVNATPNRKRRVKRAETIATMISPKNRGAREHLAREPL